MRCVLRLLLRKAFGAWIMPAPPKRKHLRTILQLELEDRITPTTY